MIVIRNATTLFALFALSLTFAASIAFGQNPISPNNDQAVRGFDPPDVFQEARQGATPEAQERRRGKRRKKSPQSADQPAEAAAPTPDSEPQESPANMVKSRRRRSARISHGSSATAGATPTPTPMAESSTSPAPTPSSTAPVGAATQLSPTAAPLLTAPSSSTTALHPAAGNSILTLPVVLGLFALTLIALIVTVFMLMRQLRRSNKPWS